MRSFFVVCCLSVCSFSLAQTTTPTVTINQKTSQADPTTSSPVLFTVTFSAPINPATFTIADISTAGSTATGITINPITEVAPNNRTTYEVSISATGNGRIVARIPGVPSGTWVPQNIVIIHHPSGHVYMANLTTNTLTNITFTGVPTTIPGTTGSATQNLADITTTSGNKFSPSTSRDNSVNLSSSPIPPPTITSVNSSTTDGTY